MMLVRPLMANLKIISEMTVLFLHVIPPQSSVYKNSHPLLVGEVWEEGGGELAFD